MVVTKKDLETGEENKNISSIYHVCGYWQIYLMFTDFWVYNVSWFLYVADTLRWFSADYCTKCFWNLLAILEHRLLLVVQVAHVHPVNKIEISCKWFCQANCWKNVVSIFIHCHDAGSILTRDLWRFYIVDITLYQNAEWIWKCY